MPDPKITTARVTTAAEVRRKNRFNVRVGSLGLFELRRLDLPTMIIDSLIPMPLLNAVDRLQSFRAELQSAKDPLATLGNLSKEDRDNMNELLRRAACVAVVNPRIVYPLIDKDGNKEPVPDDALDVTEDLHTSDLLIIWKAVLGESGIEILEPAEADTFRASQQAAPVDVVPNGGDVPSAAVEVDLPEQPAPDSTRKVEYLGNL